MRLLDVNVLLANALESHEDHLAVRRWLVSHSGMPFATCALTESSLMRLLMNPAINETPIDTATGIELLRHLHAHPSHRYLDKLPPVTGPVVAGFLSRVSGYRQVTDAYLVGVAHANGGKLATLDQKLATLFGPDVLELIEPD
jgi:toxin-antitoxin system PIN domain toxin